MDGLVLPLQWFSVLVKWIEILFLAMHPSSSNYWMLIFSPTMIGRKHHFISSKMAAVVVCCLCNGSRSWWNGLKYCFLQCIRLHRITGCSFFHPQRLGGILFSFYTFVDWFSSCTHSSSLLSDVVAFFLSCNHSSFFFFVYGCVIFLWPPFLTPLHWPLLLPFLITTFIYSHNIVHCCLYWFQQSFPFHCIWNWWFNILRQSCPS